MAEPSGGAITAIKKRVVADPSNKTYVDDATRPVSVDGRGKRRDFVTFFADKIPDTYGAPKKHVAIAS